MGIVPSTPSRPITINGVSLAMGPQTMNEVTAQNVVIVPVMDNYVRTDFGTGITEFSMSGYTGQGGRENLLAIKACEPAVGKVHAPVKFVYPHKYGTKVFMVYVDSVTTNETGGQEAFLFHYTIQMRLAAPTNSQPPILPVVANLGTIGRGG